MVIHMHLHSVYYHCNMKFSILSYAREHGDYKVIARIYQSGYTVIFNRSVQKPCVSFFKKETYTMEAQLMYICEIYA